MKQLSNPSLQRLKFILFLACLAPLARLAAETYTGDLGADPVETITRSTGIWTLNLIFATLAITPARKLTGWQWLARFRRMLALFAFFYACLHFMAYLIFDQFFDWAGIALDIGKRPFITVGFICFALLIPLAATSTDSMMRRLGGRRWLRLHRLAYLIAAAAVFHYLWLVKRDIGAPAAYAVILCLLLCARIVHVQREPRKQVVLPSPIPDGQTHAAVLRAAQGKPPRTPG